jgi:hypothetical protein
MEDYNLLTFRWRDIIMYPKTEDGNSDVWETTNMWIQSWQYCLLKFCDTDVTPSHLARQPLRFEPQFEPCVWGLFLCYQYYHWITIMMHRISPFGHWVACGCTMHLVNPHQSKTCIHISTKCQRIKRRIHHMPTATLIQSDMIHPSVSEPWY